MMHELKINQGLLIYTPYSHQRLKKIVKIYTNMP